jgi:hypothetical protein
VSWADPIAVPSAAPADLARATQKLADALEATIAAAPYQWYNFKPIWPDTPEESAELRRRAAAMLSDENPAGDAATDLGLERRVRLAGDGSPATAPAT